MDHSSRPAASGSVKPCAMSSPQRGVMHMTTAATTPAVTLIHISSPASREASR